MFMTFDISFEHHFSRHYDKFIYDTLQHLQRNCTNGIDPLGDFSWQLSAPNWDDPAFLARRMCCEGFFVRFLGSPGRPVAPCWDKLRSRDFVSLPSNIPSDYKILAAAQTEKIYTTGRWKQVQRHEARALGRCALAPKATAVTAAGWNCWDKNILSKSRCKMIFVGFCGYGWGNLLLLTSHSHRQTYASPQENNMCIWFRSNRSKRLSVLHWYFLAKKMRSTACSTAYSAPAIAATNRMQGGIWWQRIKRLNQKYELLRIAYVMFSWWLAAICKLPHYVALLKAEAKMCLLLISHLSHLSLLACETLIFESHWRL